MPAEEFASSRAIKERRAVHDVETGVVKEDDTVIWTNVSAVPVAFPDWKVVIVTSDITERREAQEKLKETLGKLQVSLRGSIQVISRIVEMRDSYTAGHQRRVTALSRAIGLEMGLAEDRVEGLCLAGDIHDLGKISVPAEILSKPTRLTESEFQLIRIHPQAGYDIVKEIDFPWPIAEIILQHHERLDGSGYPQGLRGAVILLEARILAVADVVEAIASHRPYRPALGIEAGLEELEQQKGILYDPDVVKACLTLFREKGFAFQ
jgi:HD-GYP domain-containing protein (c-di-GMP phosphodiesterase class II)